MHTDKLRQSIHQLVDQIEDVELLAAVYKIIRSSQTFDWWEDMAEQEKTLIAQGMQDLEKGETFSHEEVLEEVRKILKQA